MERALFILTVLLSLTFTTQLQGNSLPTDTFRLANEAFAQGSYADAAQLYQAIADRGYGSAILFFNLGSVYMEIREPSKARFYLEKARLLDPRDDRVIMQLDKLKESIEDPYRYPPYPLFTVIEVIHANLGINMISILFLLIWICLFVVWYLHRNKRLLHGKWMLRVVIGCTVMAAVLLFFEKTYQNFHDRMYIVRAEDVQLLPQPSEDTEAILGLKPGYKVRLKEELGPWIRVDLADGTEGWLLFEQLWSLKS